MTTAGLELEVNDVIECTEMNKDSDNELYGIVSTGTVTLYVSGAIEE